MNPSPSFRPVWEGIRDAVAEQEVVELAQALIRSPSSHDQPQREKVVAEIAAATLADNGIDVRMRPVADGRCNVIAEYPGDGRGRTLMLNGHLDTVSGDGMVIDPFRGEFHDGYVLGRGAVDMKGAVAAMIMAVVALRRIKVRLGGGVVFAGVIDEEMRSLGTEDIVMNGPRADAAIVGEPTSLDLGVAHRGLEWIEISVLGRATHSGTAHLGVNAISKMGRLMAALEERLPGLLAQRAHPFMGPPTFNFGLISGGVQPSTVADRCVLQIDRRTTPAESVKQVFQDMYDVIEELRRSDPDFRAEVTRMSSNMATMDHLPMEISLEHAIVDIARSAVETVTGRQPALISCPGWTDASLLSNYGHIPTLVLGPGEWSLAHSRNERVSARELYSATIAYAMTAAHYCS